MYQALIITHVVIAVAIIGLILLQQGRGADAGAAFGSGASGTVFGARGASSFLTRSTAVLATLFFVSSLVLAYLTDAGSESKDVMDIPEVEQISSDLPEAVNEVVKPITDLPDDLPVSQPAESLTGSEESSAVEPIESAIDAIPTDLPSTN